MHSNKKQHAYTFVELLIALTLIALFGALAAPALAKMLAHNRNQASMQEIHDHLQQARSQAVSRKQSVELCPSKNGLQCTSDWKDPWLVRLRNDQTVLYHAEAVAGKMNLRWSGFSGSIRFHSNGTSPASNGRFFICEQQTMAMQIVISRQGKIRWANRNENQQENVRCQ